MKKIKLIVCGITIASSLFLSGCGSDKPEDIAISFVKELSKANLKEANSVSSEMVQKKIIKLKATCQKPMMKNLENKAFVILNSIQKKSEANKKYEAILIKATKEISKVRNDFGEKLSQEKKKYKKEVKEEYGVEDIYSSYSLQKIPNEIQKKYKETKVGILRNQSKKVLPIMDDFFEAFDIKIENIDKIKKVIADFTARQGYFYGERIFLRAAVQNVVLDEGINQKCVAKYTDFGFVTSINVIETIKNSPDTAKVRLELIDKNSKSKKVSVNIEKIKDEWKVSKLSFKNIGFW